MIGNKIKYSIMKKRIHIKAHVTNCDNAFHQRDRNLYQFLLNRDTTIFRRRKDMRSGDKLG